jgi:hypothetical protein
MSGLRAVWIKRKCELIGIAVLLLVMALPNCGFCAGSTLDAGDVRLAKEVWPIARAREEVKKSRERLKSVYFEADVVGRTAVTPDGVVRRRRVKVAISGNRRFLESAHVNPGFEWYEDPDWTWSYFDGESLSAFWVLNRYFETSQKQARDRILFGVHRLVAPRRFYSSRHAFRRTTTRIGTA